MDKASGAWIIQLTGAAAISNNIYGEQPYCSPDGKRIIIARCKDFSWDTFGSLLVTDLQTLQTAMVVPQALGVRNVFTSAWSGLMYYWTPQRKLMRLSLMTLESEQVYEESDADFQLTADDGPSTVTVDGGGSSVSPDHRYILLQAVRMKGPNAPIFQIVRIDLHKGIRETIYEDPEISNAHLQFNPTNPNQFLVQNNAGTRMSPEGKLVHNPEKRDLKLFTLDVDGGNKQYLPVGHPISPRGSGHECFLADTGKVMWSIRWDGKGDQMIHDQRFAKGNIMTARPGDQHPTPFIAPEHFFNHVSASKCGRYFVADSYEHGRIFDDNMDIKPVSLVIGNFNTGRYRTLVQNTMTSSGNNQSTHTHPYLTADNRHVIFNADPYHAIPQVYAAKVSESFLQSLDHA